MVTDVTPSAPSTCPFLVIIAFSIVISLKGTPKGHDMKFLCKGGRMMVNIDLHINVCIY